MLKNSTKITEAANAFVTAMMAEGEAPDQEAIQAALEQFGNVLTNEVVQSLSTQREDTAALAGRNQHVLTAEERKYYEALIKAGQSDRPTQALSSLIPDGMPMTIIEDVTREVLDSHPLLQAVNYINVGYLTRWVVPNNTADTATWGAVGSAITKQIEAAFTTLEITQNKLSAYTEIELDMLQLGPTFIDGYVRQFLAESISIGLEKAIVTGSGLNEPIGLDCVIGNNVQIGNNGYAKKTPVALTSFAPEVYGPVLDAAFSNTELGNPRNFDRVILVCSQKAYLNKVMPASTVITANGNYVSDVFPVPTEVIKSNYVPKRYGNDAADNDYYGILFIPGEYDVLVGAGKTGAIEYSDEFKFLDDKRVLKTKIFATGRAKDATTAIVVDMRNMEPAYIYVKDMSVDEA